MSTKYWPTVFAVDMSCDLVAHIEAREPELARMMWEDRSGCFEKPTLTNEPQVIIIKVVITCLILNNNYADHSLTIYEEYNMS